ncbi:MAG TPA: SRPBCC domain-containing protein [Tepidisphaeraceae bacterium]|jgi:uncharacterized protein YndB with AHSA1/START domain
MPVTTADQKVETFEFTREETIDAPIEIVFEAILDEIGPESQMPDGKPMAMSIEARPGGRWVRELGSGAGHFWGHVQVIKPPSLLELCGPMFMSYPAMNHVQYRLTPDGDGGTRLKFTHKSLGLIPREHREGMEMGWGYKLGRIRELARRKESKR